jgi:hypothetical protein
MEDPMMSAWKSVFTQSPANDGYYEEDELPQQHWTWPKGTWFQSRLDHIRERQSARAMKARAKLRDAGEMRTL